MKTIKIFLTSLIIGLSIITSTFAHTNDNLETSIIIKKESQNISIEYKAIHSDLFMTILESEEGIILKKEIKANSKINFISYATLGGGSYIIIIEDLEGNVVAHHSFAVPE